MMKLKTLLIELIDGGQIEMENVECETLSEFDHMLNGHVKAKKVKITNLKSAGDNGSKRGHPQKGTGLVKTGARLLALQTMARAPQTTWKRETLQKMLQERGWGVGSASATVTQLVGDGLAVKEKNGRIKLTDKGRKRAEDPRLRLPNK